MKKMKNPQWNARQIKLAEILATKLERGEGLSSKDADTILPKKLKIRFGFEAFLTYAQLGDNARKKLDSSYAEKLRQGIKDSKGILA